MWNWLKRIFGGVKKFFVRTGLDKFLSQYIQVAMEVIAELALVHSNAEFHLWKDKAFERVRNEIGKPIAGTWIAILINLAYENFKASQPGVSRTEVK